MLKTETSHQLREHLALISTEAYLMLKALDEDERYKRYKRVQEQIKAILETLGEHHSSQYSHSDPITPDISS